MPVHISMSNGLPRCEGWLEKFSVGRGLFSTHNWQKRYVLVAREGIGYMHHAAEPSTRPASAHCFIPFEEPHRKRDGGKQRPVYLLRHVAPFMHPEISTRDRGGDSSTSTVTEKSEYDHFFAISFTEGERRLFLLLRCPSLEEYVVWTSVLSLYIPAGSLNTIVPIPHPLEAHHYSSSSASDDPKSRKKSFKLKGYHPAEKAFGSLYRKDPDPCTPRELKRINRRVLEWDEGERARWLDIYKEELSFSGGTVVLQKRNEEEWSKLLYISAELDAACDEDSVASACSDTTVEKQRVTSGKMGTSMCVPRRGRDDHPLAYFGIPVSTLVVYEQRSVSQSTNYIPSVPVLLQDIAFYWDTQHETNYTGGDTSGNSSPSAVSPDSIWIASAEKAINDFAKKSKLLSLDKRVRVEKKKNSRAEKSSGRRANRVFEKPFRTLFAKTPIRAPHFVALLTLFLRKLPEPLLPPLFVRQMEEILLNSNMSETARSQALQKVDRQSFNSNYAAEHATFQYLKQLVQRHRAELIAAEVEILVRAMLRESNECVVEFMIHQVRPLVNPVIHPSKRESSVGSNNGHGKSNNSDDSNRKKNIESVSNVQMDAVSVESNDKKTSEAESVLYSSASSHHLEPQEKVEDNKCTPAQSEASAFTSSDDSSEMEKDIQEGMKKSKEELNNEEKDVAAPRRRTSTTSTTTNATTTTTIGERSQNAGVALPLTTMECACSTESSDSSASEEENSNKSIISSIHDENNNDDEFDHDDDNDKKKKMKKKTDDSCTKEKPVTTEWDEEASDVVMIRPGDGEYKQGMSIRQSEEINSKKEHTSQMKEKETTKLSETVKVDSESSVVGGKQSTVKKNKRQGTQMSKNHIVVTAATADAAVAADGDDSNNDNDVTDENEDEKKKKKNENGDRSKFIKKVDRGTNYAEVDLDAVLPEVNSSTQSFPKQNLSHHDRYAVPIKTGKEQMRAIPPESLKEYPSQSERKTLEFPNGSYTSQPVLNSFPYREKETHNTVTGGRRFVEEHPRHAALLLAKQMFLGNDYLPPTRLQLDSKSSELTLSSDVKNTIKDESNAYPLSQFSEIDKPPCGGNTVDEHVFMSEESAFSFPQREQQLELQQEESENRQLRNPVIQSLLTKVEELNAQCNSLAQLVSSKMTPTTEPHQDQMMITKEVEEKMLLLKDVVRQVAECHSATVGDVLKLQEQVIQQQQELETVLVDKQSWRNDAISAKEAALEMQRRCANVELAQLEGQQQLQYMSAVLKDLAYKLECGEKENLDLKVEIAALQRQSMLLREKLLSSP